MQIFFQNIGTFSLSLAIVVFAITTLALAIGAFVMQLANKILHLHYETALNYGAAIGAIFGAYWSIHVLILGGAQAAFMSVLGILTIVVVAVITARLFTSCVKD